MLPDFHQLVNFPENMIRGKMLSVDGSCKSTPNALSGKKLCVMCGKLRISASYARSQRDRDLPMMNVGEDDDGCGTHIIPRQNKGVCTACDVTVWVALEMDGLEIKWCKGCKNFRTWAAFGFKGTATKCVRCRERQKEKYALAKQILRTSSGAGGDLSSVCSANTSSSEKTQSQKASNETDV